MENSGIHSIWLKEPAGPRTLLAVFAHPDDESFGSGGTLARYTAAGVAVHCACATRGEAGTVDAKWLTGFATVGELRWTELEAAATVLGLSGLHWLGYRDSGMPGAADHHHPDALVRADQHLLVGKIVALIRALRPQVVITFDEHGGYGHPDHVAISQATRRAFAVAGDPTCYPEQVAQGLTAFGARKLYYTAFPRTLLKLMVTAWRLLGRDPTRFGRNRDINLAMIATWEQHITTRIDVRAHVDIKLRASACYRSQDGSGSTLAWLPGLLRRCILGAETFIRAVPPALDAAPLETDLLAGT